MNKNNCNNEQTQSPHKINTAHESSIYQYFCKKTNKTHLVVYINFEELLSTSYNQVLNFIFVILRTIYCFSNHIKCEMNIEGF